jgi:hypothetical protein
MPVGKGFRIPVITFSQVDAFTFWRSGVVGGFGFEDGYW